MPDCPAYGKWPEIYRVTTQDDPVQTDCYCGTPWSQTVSQQTMAGYDGDSKIVVNDGIHEVSDVEPIHLPYLWAECDGQDFGVSCYVNVTTVTEPYYDVDETADLGLNPISAVELRTKMKCRQAMELAAGFPNVNFTETDELTNVCRDINQKAYNWALENASETARERFQKYGQPMFMGNDLGPYNAGPLWINYQLRFTDQEDSLMVQSPMMYTDVDYFLPLAKGFHYCKLLSPARAMEWVYLDGLRKNLSN